MEFAYQCLRPIFIFDRVYITTNTNRNENSAVCCRWYLSMLFLVMCVCTKCSVCDTYHSLNQFLPNFIWISVEQLWLDRIECDSMHAMMKAPHQAYNGSGVWIK